MQWNTTTSPRRWLVAALLLLPLAASGFLLEPLSSEIERIRSATTPPRDDTSHQSAGRKIRVVAPFVLHMATSSKDLKTSNQKNKKRAAKTVATRLAKAAKEAAASKPDNSVPESPFRKPKPIPSSNSRGDEHLKSITDLSKTIDEELLRPRDGYRPPRETSSMRTLLVHNDKAEDSLSDDKNAKKAPKCRNVAMVFSKPLWKDQITTEYACRLILLAQMMKNDDYRPSLICFCGSTNPKQDNLVSETAAGVLFFRHVCAANEISLEGIDICITNHEDARISSVTSLHPVAEQLYNRHCLESWLEQSEVYEAATDEYGMTREQPRKKIHIHFTLISTDYHLCNLNDIHMRSPRQSPLNAMLEELEHSIRSFRGLAKITWQFKYSTYPYVDSKDQLTVFLGKCYHLAQELRPLLVNIRGVANQDEFFQRDNYRVLVSTRRTLVTLLEEMNEAFRHKKERKTTTGLVPPSLKARLQTTIVEGYSKSSNTSGRRISGDVSTDVALESALLSLGRCADLIRPAGRLTSQSVSQEKWRDAIRQLEHFLDLMETACDPDRPLPAHQWGMLSIAPNNVTDDDDSISMDASDLAYLSDTIDASSLEMLDLADLFGEDIGMDDSME